MELFPNYAAGITKKFRLSAFSGGSIDLPVAGEIIRGYRASIMVGWALDASNFHMGEEACGIGNGGKDLLL